MKILAVSALLCAMMALTTAAAVPEEEPEDAQGAVPEEESEDEQAVELDVVKRTHCHSGWKLIGHRYFFYVAQHLTWAQAEKKCVSLGGHLASVHSQWEYHQIRSLIKAQSHGHPAAWVGGTDSCQEGVWRWSDGSCFDFKQWCRGEPNNGLGTNQDCLQINFSCNKCWDDLWCHHRRPSVCVRKW
ncbi:type-2 ice-structuring protein-like isoform X3 [Notolabrus celidotus]|uniref:type-2 ice-structuring protein-like isoform X3 n=1 Tax=Notolabrus celidotus TaxID=1203425 RepID=UPI0014902C24|nr:type-2 ice-structuring protein-like isoform X3 [Notolabrus celidotus]XP_034532343.1 type-2 ice-structuring protein-like isoform X3 [Notolabrus celidotus]